MYKKIIVSPTSHMKYVSDLLKESIAKAFSNTYEELYEITSDDNGDLLLEDTLIEILDCLKSSYQTLGQIRYVWMAIVLAVVVEPTVRNYQPDSKIPEQTINRLTEWLIKRIELLFRPNAHDSNTENIKVIDLEDLISTKKISSFQILLEALDVYANAIKTLEPNDSLQALLDILDDCLEGYAIFPGSHGRRELFDWWLLDVVPSCWWLRPPSYIYSLKDSNYSEEIIMLRRLKKISDLIWNLILNFASDQIENNDESKSLSFNDGVKNKITYDHQSIATKEILVA